MTATTAPAPVWLSALRSGAAEELPNIAMPQFRGTPGWEFTEIPDLDLDAYPTAQTPDASLVGSVVESAPRVFDHLPEGTIRLTQVDHAVIDERRALSDPAAGKQPIVLPLEVAAAEHPELVERYLGKIETSRTPFTARNDRDWTGGFFVYVPRGVHLEAPVLLTLIQDQAGRTVSPRTLIVLEEGAEAEVWSETVSTSPSSTRWSTASSSCTSGRTRGCVSSTSRTSPRRRGSSGPSGPRSSATAGSTGSASASARPRARSSRRRRSTARAPTGA